MRIHSNEDIKDDKASRTGDSFLNFFCLCVANSSILRVPRVQRPFLALHGSATFLTSCRGGRAWYHAKKSSGLVEIDRIVPNQERLSVTNQCGSQHLPSLLRREGKKAGAKSSCLEGLLGERVSAKLSVHVVRFSC